MAAAGYNVVYKGKWHLSKPAGQQLEPSDVEKYGFTRWNPPDAGANQDIDQEGGGTTRQRRQLHEPTGIGAAGAEGVLQYLNSAAPRSSRSSWSSRW